MAYDSKTYGQSPFGKPIKPDGSDQSDVKSDIQSDSNSDRLEKANTAKSPRAAQPAQSPPLADTFPVIPAATPSSQSPLAKTQSSASNPADNKARSKSRSRKSSAKTTAAKTTARKSKSKKEAQPAQFQTEAAEPMAAQRFSEEDRRAYLSLLYKTGISGLVWAVLRLSRHELSERAIAIINVAIHPFMVACLAVIATIALTFWTRHLLGDLAQHTQKLHADAEMPDGQNYRPTLEIVGDALAYNPKFRKNVAALFNAASIVICSLVSYLITFALFPTD
ncbi:MAG: hypothetical protein WBC73_03510 [Phormidesmis sp.]